MIKEILAKATALGACRLTKGVTSWKALAQLFFSPQGLEFCEGHHFPEPDDWKDLRGKASELRKQGIYLNAGKISYEGDGNLALVGNTQGNVKFNANDRISRILLLNGATAHIEATNYAVVDIHCDATSQYTIAKDKTVVML